jgi:hypothetical protein
MHTDAPKRSANRVSLGTFGLLVSSLVGAAVLAYSWIPSGQAVGVSALMTDKNGYLAGETVTISGSGFYAGEAVTLQVTHADGGAELGMAHEAQVVVADDNGAFTATWSVNLLDEQSNEFTASAVGNTSGASTPAVFGRIATVSADKFDYLPGDTAQLSGEGFLPGEEVTLQVLHISGLDSGAGHGPMTVFAAQDGHLSQSWYVDPDDSRGALFVLHATGMTSGLQAQTIFMDLTVTIVDDQGADDYPGQKDLNQLTVNSDDLPTSVEISWNWDDTAWSGNNTGDACSLFDTDADGNANYALCVTVGGSPAKLLANSSCTANKNPFNCCSGAGTGTCGTGSRLYSCGDSRADRCDQPTTLISPISSICMAAVSANADPFGVLASPYYDPDHVSGNTCSATTACYTSDTVAACDVLMADFGSSSAALINVCSFPSEEPNSAPSECVVTPNSGFLTIVKNVQTADNPMTSFTFDLGTGQTSQDGSSSWTITTNATDSVNLIPFAAGTYDLSEDVPPNWSLDSASCSIQTNPPSATGTPVLDGVNDFAINSGLETVCTFNDSSSLLSCTTDTDCDDNNPCTTDTCVGTAPAAECVYTAAPTSTVCRTGSGDLCDPDETCDGTTTVCPADVVAPATTTCNPGSGDLCDPDESCTGTPGAA